MTQASTMADTDNRLDIGEILERIARNAPEPIADVAAAASVECAGPDDQRAHMYLSRTVEIILHFLGILSAVEYSRAAREEGEKRVRLTRRRNADIRVDSLLTDRPLSAGSWGRVFAECIEPFVSHRDLLFCPELLDTAKSNGGVWLKLAGDRVHSRNEIVGHAYITPSERFVEERRKAESDAFTLLNGLSFLSSYQLVRIVEDVSEGSASEHTLARIEDRTGSRWRRSSRVIRLHGAREHIRSARNHIVLLSRTDESVANGHLAVQKWLDLHPLITTSDDVRDQSIVDEEISELMMFRGKSGRKSMYIGVRTNARSTSDIAEALETRLRRDVSVPQSLLGISLQSANDSSTIDKIWRNCVERTGAFLGRARSEQVYLREAFVDRPVAREYMEEWRSSDDGRVLLLTGMAGAGKTSLLCRTAETFISSGEADAVLLVNASEIPIGVDDTGAPNASSWASKQFGWSGTLDALCHAWTTAPWSTDIGGHLQRPGHLLLLVDGIDRTPDPEACVQAISRLMEATARAGGRGLRIACTIALPLLVGLRDSIQSIPCLWRDLEGPGGGLALGIDNFSDEELQRAYDTYRALPDSRPRTSFESLPPSIRAAIRNPLVLRMTCLAYDGIEIDRQASEANVMAKYAEKEIMGDLGKRHFVRRLIDFHIIGSDTERPPRRSIPVDHLMLDPLVRDAMLSPAGPYQQLVESHILTEHSVAGVDGYSLPSRHVEFAFDALLGYLIFALESDESSEHIAETRIVRYSRSAPSFAPMGFAVDLILRTSGSALRMRMLRRLLHDDVAKSGIPSVARHLEWADAQHPMSTSELLNTSVLDELVAPDLELDSIRRDVARQLAEIMSLSVGDTIQIDGEHDSASRECLLLVRGIVEDSAKDRRAGPSRSSLVALARELRARGSYIVAAHLAREILSRRLSATHGSSETSQGTGVDDTSRWMLEQIFATACLRHGSEQALAAAEGRLRPLVDVMTSIASNTTTQNSVPRELWAEVRREMARILIASHRPQEAWVLATDGLRDIDGRWERDLAVDLHILASRCCSQNDDECDDDFQARRAEHVRIAARLLGWTSGELRDWRPTSERGLYVLMSAGSAFLSGEALRSLLTRCEDISRRLGRPDIRSEICVELAQLYRAEADYSRWMDNAEKSLQYAETARSTGTLLAAMDSLAYAKMRGDESVRNVAEARAIIVRHAKLAWSTERLFDVGRSFNLWAILSVDDGDAHHAAMATAVSARVLDYLATGRGYRVDSLRANVYSNMAEMEALMGRSSLAVAVALRGREFASTEPTSRFVGWAELALGRAYSAYAANMKRNGIDDELTKALEHLKRAAVAIRGRDAAFTKQWTCAYAEYLSLSGRATLAVSELLAILPQAVRAEGPEGIREGEFARPRSPDGEMDDVRRPEPVQAIHRDDIDEILALVAWIVREVDPELSVQICEHQESNVSIKSVGGSRARATPELYRLYLACAIALESIATRIETSDPKRCRELRRRARERIEQSFRQLTFEFASLFPERDDEARWMTVDRLSLYTGNAVVRRLRTLMHCSEDDDVALAEFGGSNDAPLGPGELVSSS